MTRGPEDDRAPRATAASFSVIIGAAAVAAAMSVVVALLVRIFTGLLTPAEFFGDRATVLIPLPLFSAFLQVFGSNAKHLYFVALLVSEALLAFAGGLVYWWLRQRLSVLRRLDRPDASRPGLTAVIDVVAIVVLFVLVTGGLFAPLLRAGLFGSAAPGGTAPFFISLSLSSVAFALSFILLLRRELPAAVPTQSGETVNRGRRALLGRAVLAVAILGGGALLWEAVNAGVGAALGVGRPSSPRLKLGAVPERISPPPTPRYGTFANAPGQVSDVTPPDQFYYVSKNLASDPLVDGAGWHLAVKGMVERPQNLTYADLVALPRVEQYHTLSCISNEVGGNLISNALFTGVSLADLLQSAGIQPGASELIFRAADGYSDSLHLSQALDPRSLIALEISGQQLPQAHGYPARLLIPDLYGMKNGKWLTELEVASGTYTGYWEQQGWTREAHVKLMTRVDVPRDRDLLVANPMTIAGIAFAGARGIAQVDVSTDAGQTWQAATLRHPLGALTWVLWQLPWSPGPGEYVITARSIDLDGNVQTPQPAPPLPDGASGYHAVSVVVR